MPGTVSTVLAATSPRTGCGRLPVLPRRRLRLILPSESDLAAPLRFRRRRHELADGVDQLPDRIVMGAHFLLEFGQLAGKFLVGGNELAQLDKGAHDKDADLDSPRAVENIG